MALHQVLILGLVALLVCSSSEGFEGMLKACAQEAGTTVTLKDAHDFMKTGEATKNLKCALGCVMTKVNAVNDDGTLKVDYILSVTPAHKAAMFRKCSTFPPGDVCENSYLHFKCYLENDIEYFNSQFLPLIRDL